MSDYAVELKDINVSLKNSHILDNMSFHVPANTVTGFIGTNGAGKTTTIMSILGLVKASSGLITVLDREIPRQVLPFDQIGVVFDSNYLYEELTLKQMKRVIASAYKNWDEPLYQSYIQKFGLTADKKIGELSKGMKMKYSIALALSHKPKLLIMDEPVSGLDPIVRRQFMRIITDYKEQQKATVFYSTHILSDLDAIADYIVIIDNGRVIMEEYKDKVSSGYVLVNGSSQYMDPGYLIGARACGKDRMKGVALKENLQHLPAKAYQYENIDLDTLFEFLVSGESDDKNIPY